ncbi:MAG: oligopeptidase B [Flavobacterium sp. BFFFF2]|nr:MAG: oligopeptidase B [Flavobacterium sp. BFFFF2]
MSTDSSNTFPIAAAKPHLLTAHGETRIDPYYWLNNPDDPEVINYLEAENSYYKASSQHLDSFKEQLFLELKSRIKEQDESVPYHSNGYTYLVRMETGKEYPIYLRKPQHSNEEPTLIIDVNERAVGHAYYQLSGLTISDDNQWLAFSVDTQSRRQYTIWIKNLIDGTEIETPFKDATGEIAWAADNETLYYVRKDRKTLRAYQVWQFKKSDPKGTAQLVYEEDDDTFDVTIYRSKSKKYLMLSAESTMTTEYRMALANDPNPTFEVFHARERGLEYSVSHFNEQFYILTNADGATNFKLMTAAEGATDRSNWTEVLPHREDVLLEGLDVFAAFLVVSERANGLEQIHIYPKDGEAYYLPFPNETYTTYTTTNLDFDTDWLRYAFQSLATPTSVLEYNMKTRETVLLKEQMVMGGDFDKSNYLEKRCWATARDGVQVPISMVYHKNTVPNEHTPVMLYGYGSYGLSMECHFSTVRLSLLNRGFIFAIAHVRGGEEMGREWYEDGKLFKKWHTFHDFIDCGQYLVDQQYTCPNHLYAEGGSAGGLLMGVVINERPDLFHGVIAQVPFVDVVTTMLDESIPLTTGEYDEWGNPNEKAYYDYMLSYSPYDQVKAQSYPHLMVTTGLHDSQVQYWEPAKWVAKLRTVKANSTQLYLITQMEAGHGGKSGRFEALREIAQEYVFLLDLEGIGL